MRAPLTGILPHLLVRTRKFEARAQLDKTRYEIRDPGAESFPRWHLEIVLDGLLTSGGRLLTATVRLLTPDF